MCTINPQAKSKITKQRVTAKKLRDVIKYSHKIAKLIQKKAEKKKGTEKRTKDR
jgi:hypothetical protein